MCPRCKGFTSAPGVDAGGRWVSHPAVPARTERLDTGWQRIAPPSPASIYPDQLFVHKLLNARAGQFTAIARVFHTAERQLG